jgi:hypothetical protein
MARAKDWDVPMLKNMKEYASVSSLSQEQVAEVYSNIAHFLPPTHKEYLEKLLRGEADTDVLLDLEMFFRLVTIYATQAVMWAMDEKKVSRDIGSILGEVRQGAVAIEGMRAKRADVSRKKDGNDDGVDIDSRKSALDLFESLP